MKHLIQNIYIINKQPFFGQKLIKNIIFILFNIILNKEKKN